MADFLLAPQLYLSRTDTQCADRCYAYAADELARLLARLGVSCVAPPGSEHTAGYALCLSSDAVSPCRPFAELPAGDGYLLAVAPSSVLLAARSAKGVLNGVYDLAERLGFLFLLPGEEGEWPPLEGAHALPEGTFVMQPRFPHHGVFWQTLNFTDYTVEEWLRFYAKLRCNAVAHDLEDRALAEELGLRLEIGGHGLSSLLPRDLFEAHPEYFRLFQPEDFGGTRQPDSNMCVTNPHTRRIMQEHFRPAARAAEGVYAYHAWADDLPAGGWCLCSSCRALQPADQALLATRHLAEVVRAEGLALRVPICAYHDTMFPGNVIAPPPESLLLFAPRERCYGHALDDPRCARNQFYLQALQAWMTTFAGIDDAHAFEYYFDQILFRGLYPFLPQIMLDDLRVYQAHGIQTMLSLQVAGPAVAPEYNMLVFARGAWDAYLTADDCCAALAARICPQAPAPWGHYFMRRAAIFQDALRMCEYPTNIYLDYRWLPENRLPFGAEMASVYAEAAEALEAEATMLAEAVTADWPERVQRLAVAEVARAQFEAAELRVMWAQQQAANALAGYLDSDDQTSLRAALTAWRYAQKLFTAARHHAKALGLPPDGWYLHNINEWLTDEFARKIDMYAPMLRDGDDEK
ncbi:MAG TPA: hypothetical protein VGL77_12375 [Armatimonadota bacterium]|jgi:hypothetical protein